MPELPEVLTICQSISYLVGMNLTVLTPLSEKLTPGIFEAKDSLVGDKLVAVSNMAKYIVLTFDSGKVWVIHLGMTGSLLYSSQHPVFRTLVPMFSLFFTGQGEGGTTLYFFDARRFAKFFLFENMGDLMCSSRFNTLGPTFLELDQQMVLQPVSTQESVVRRLHQNGPNRSIKDVLLDQHSISGAGNIYACEALWQAKIHPHTRVGDLLDADLLNLFRFTVDSLHLGLKAGGTTISDFARPDGTAGGSQHLKVFKRAGHPCPVCLTSIVRIVTSGRGSYICPSCQSSEVPDLR